MCSLAFSISSCFSVMGSCSSSTRVDPHNEAVFFRCSCMAFFTRSMSISLCPHTLVLSRLRASERSCGLADLLRPILTVAVSHFLILAIESLVDCLNCFSKTFCAGLTLYRNCKQAYGNVLGLGKGVGLYLGTEVVFHRINLDAWVS